MAGEPAYTWRTWGTAVRVGVTLPTTRSLTYPEAIAELAASAEDSGYASVWVSDHVLVPSGRDFPPQHQLDAKATLAYLAAHTKRSAIGSSVLVLPYRDPVPVDKALSTIDWLSGGRLVVGVGVGWLEAEFGALGIPFAERGAPAYSSGLAGGAPLLVDASERESAAQGRSLPRSGRKGRRDTENQLSTQEGSRRIDSHD